MPIQERLLVHNAKVERKQVIQGKGLSSAWQVLSESVECLIVPATAQDSIQQNITVGQDFIMALNDDPVSIQKGDRITRLNDNKVFLVDGVANYKDIPRVGHVQVALKTVES